MEIKEGDSINLSKQINRLIPKANKLLGNKEKTLLVLQQGFHLIRGKKEFSDLQDDIVNLFKLAKDSIQGEYKGLSKKNLVLIIAGIIYLVNPVDLVPDFIIGLGFADDLAILTYIISKLEQEIHAYKEWSQRGNEE